MVKLVACRGICDVPFWLLFEFDDLLELASDDDLEAKDEDLILQLGAILIFDFFSEFWRSLDGQNSTNCKEKLKFYSNSRDFSIIDVRVNLVKLVLYRLKWLH